jgi:hypothetical protein
MGSHPSQLRESLTNPFGAWISARNAAPRHYARRHHHHTKQVITMTKAQAGNNAGSERTPIEKPKTISPAARKFAEYLARRMLPMIESTAKRTEATRQPNGVVAAHTQTKGS